MDDSCAVCAENLEWVAYGPCGHREVCSTCVARLRFICDDHHCCICKTESSVVFVTKALGDYTRMINDFSVLPSELREGQVGSYWYHEDTQAFFDDLDHYKMIKAMCRLSCSVCDNMEEQPKDTSKRRAKFRNIEQLKGHLFHRHRLFMCSLCLEGRKIFICEQKLYTRAQLNQHINTGDSEVDGSESERGGFMGHPMCEFCRTPFYGDNELYSHMSTEHYTCHICQRQHPGQYEYYKSYDDLEIHFRREHFLCEDEACLAKKFVVFQSEAEMKRHNAKEHGGRMSRSQRIAALQIPTSFRYRRSSEQDNRRGRGRTFRRDSSDDILSMAVQASFETANADGTFHDPTPSASSTQIVSDHMDTDDTDPIIQPFESLTTTDSEASSRYLQALSHSRNVPLEESSFPPLPIAPGGSQSQSQHSSEGLPKNTMAAHLRRKNNRNVIVLNSGRPSPASIRGPLVPSSSSTQYRPTTSNAPVVSSSSGQVKPLTANGPSPSSYASSAQAWPTPVHGLVSAGSLSSKNSTSNMPVSSSSSGQVKPLTANGPSPFSYASSAQAWPTPVHGLVSASSLSSKNSGSTSGMSHSSSAPNLADSGSFDPSISDFPPVSATQMPKFPTSSQALSSVEGVHTANKLLVEKIRAALEFDEDRYAAFKDISGQYRQGLIDTGKYLAYVQQFGLSHLVLELARLCPDAEKQIEIIEIYSASLQSNGPPERGLRNGNVRLKDSSGSRKGKGKRVDTEETNSKNTLADSVISTVRELQSSYKPSVEDAEVLSKDGYRATDGKSKVVVDEEQAELSSGSQVLTKMRGQNDSPSAGAGSNQNLGDGGGGSKQRKKASKFHRIRLGDGSAAAFINSKKLDLDNDPELMEEPLNGDNSAEGLPVRGVWRNGGGQRLFAAAPRDLRK